MQVEENSQYSSRLTKALKSKERKDGQAESCQRQNKLTPASVNTMFANGKRVVPGTPLWGEESVCLGLERRGGRAGEERGSGQPRRK